MIDGRHVDLSQRPSFLLVRLLPCNGLIKNPENFAEALAALHGCASEGLNID